MDNKLKKTIESEINLINLLFTDTIDRSMLCNKNFNSKQYNIDYTSSVNLYDIAETFHKKYSAFIKEYEHLDKIDLGLEVKPKYFAKSNKGDLRCLELFIEYPRITDHIFTNLHIVENDGKITSYVSNNINSRETDYYNDIVFLDEKKCKCYLDLFEKYQSLIKFYYICKNRQLFGDGTYSLFINIKNEQENNNFLESMKSICYGFGGCFFDKTDNYYNVSLKLGDQITIDYNSTTIQHNEDIVKVSDEELLSLLKSVYINKKHLDDEYSGTIGIFDKISNITTTNDLKIDDKMTKSLQKKK